MQQARPDAEVVRSTVPIEPSPVSIGQSFLATHGVELEAVYANAPVGLCVLDRDLRFVRINERLAAMNGPSVAEHLGRTVREVLPDLADEAEPRLRRILDTGEAATDVEVNGATPAQPGVERTWLESWIPLRDGDGAIIGINVVAHDVTERRRIEQRLHESEVQFRELVEQSSMATVVYDHEGRLVHANGAFEALWKASLADVPADYRVTNDPQLTALGALPVVLRAFSGEPVTLPPLRYVPSASGLVGEPCHVEARFFPIHDAKMGVKRVVGVFQDVSARIEEENDNWFLFELGSVLQSLAAPAAICDMATRRIAEHLGADRCAWLSVDADNDTVTVRKEWLRSGSALTGTYALQRWPQSPGEEHPSRAAVAFDDTLTDERSASRHQELFAPIGVRAFLRVPMISHGQWMGSLSVASEQPRRWTGREITLMRRVAERVWPAFEAALQATRAEAERARTERLQHVTASLTAAATRQEVCNIIAGEGSAAVGAAAGVVALLSDDGEHIEFAGWVGYPIASLGDWQRLPLALATPLTKAVRLGRPVWIDSRQEMKERFAEFYPASQAIPTGAWGVVPFVIRSSGGHPALGALGLSFTEEGAVPRADRAMAETIAALGASALERVRLFEAEQQARIRTERLQRVTAALSRAVTAHEVSGIIMAEGMELLGASGAVLALRSEDGAIVEIRDSRGISQEVIAEWRRVPIDAPLPLAEATRTSALVHVESRADFEARYPTLAVLVQDRGIEGSIILPLVSAGSSLGACGFDFPSPRQISSEERDLLQSLAGQCAQALDRANLFEREHEARRAAELANQAKSTFLAAMSHELRTPLNAIQGHVQLIELEVHGPINDAQRIALERVQRNQRHLLTLVNDLLNLSRIESGRVEYNMSPIPLAELVGEVSEMIAPQLQAKALQYEWAVDERLVVRADREKAAQILINLLDNAVKFTPAGGSVRVSCHTRAETPDYVYVRVTDTGRGIGGDKLKRIFEPFVQIDKVATSKDEGVGLGLSISRELARGMRGELRARSTLGQGSTFTLSLCRSDGRSRKRANAEGR